jgi:hypothetical protein
VENSSVSMHGAETLQEFERRMEVKRIAQRLHFASRKRELSSAAGDAEPTLSRPGTVPAQDMKNS